MLNLAFENNSNILVNDYDLMNEKTSYAYDTISYFKKQNPDYDFSLVVGSDIICDIEKWYRWKDLSNLVNFIVYEREGYDVVERPDINYQVIKTDSDNISSSTIRKLVGENKSINGLVPKLIESYIINNNLYKNSKQYR